MSEVPRHGDAKHEEVMKRLEVLSARVSVARWGGMRRSDDDELTRRLRALRARVETQHRREAG